MLRCIKLNGALERRCTLMIFSSNSIFNIFVHLPSVHVEQSNIVNAMFTSLKYNAKHGWKKEFFLGLQACKTKGKTKSVYVLVAFYHDRIAFKHSLLVTSMRFCKPFMKPNVVIYLGHVVHESWDHCAFVHVSQGLNVFLDFDPVFNIK